MEQRLIETMRRLRKLLKEHKEKEVAALARSQKINEMLERMIEALEDMKAQEVDSAAE